MRMSLIENVDKEPNNLYAAGVFHTTTKNESGQPVTMACFLRIETKPNMALVRVTAHAGHKSVSVALISSFALLMGGTEK